MRLQRPLIQKRRFPVLLRTSGDPRQGPAGRRGWLYARKRSARPRRAGNTRGTRSARRPGGRAPRATSSGGSPSLARVARAEVNTATSSGRVFASPRPSPQDRWTCSPPLGARSMSRFPAVAGRAPRRQEEGERSRDLQEERPSAGSVADRGAVRGTPRRPEGVVARGFGGGGGGGDESPPETGGEEEAAGCSLPVTLHAGGELCVQRATLDWRGAVPDLSWAKTLLGGQKVHPNAGTRPALK